MYFILGLGAAFNLSARLRSCCKLAENCLHTQGLKFCNPFGATSIHSGTQKCNHQGLWRVKGKLETTGCGVWKGMPETSAQIRSFPEFTSSNTNFQ